jgi:hypothetical protein
MKPGDKVCKTPLLSSGEEPTFYSVKSVDVASNSFMTDPNGPFEKSWKGRLTEHKPHHVYPGYWVPVVGGIVREAATRAIRESRGLSSQTPKVNKSQTSTTEVAVKSQYKLCLNWYGELFDMQVKAYSQDQAMVVASMHLAANELKAHTALSIHQYMKNNETRVSIKQMFTR